MTSPSGVLPLLDIERLSVGYDGVPVVREVSLRLEEGEAVALLGANGAGKTTLLRAVCGLLSPVAGRVRIDGEVVRGGSTPSLARQGVVLVPTDRHLFPRMTVDENLALGAYPGRPDPATKRWVHELFPRLRERAGQRAGTMSGGEQQMLAIGRAVMGRPRLLLLDEPSTGLAPRAAASTFAALQRLRADGMTLLVAEQQMALALDLADRGYLLAAGGVRLAGPAALLRDDERVRRATLGLG